MNSTISVLFSVHSLNLAFKLVIKRMDNATGANYKKEHNALLSLCHNIKMLKWQKSFD